MKPNVFKILTLGISICILSCKKEKNAPPAPMQEIRGDLSATIEKDSNSNISEAYSIVQFMDPISTHISFEGGSAISNGVILDGHIGGSSYYYNKYWYSSPPFNCLENIIWNCTGNEKVPAFSYTTLHPIPYIDTSYISIDSISIANGITFSHPIIHASTIKYELYYNITGSPTEINKTVLGNSAGITFSSMGLSNASFQIGMQPELILTVTSKESYSPKVGVILNFKNVCIIRKRIIMK